MLLIVGPGLAAAFHRARLPTLTLRDCPALSVSYLQAFHLLLARDEATAALLCPSPLTDVPSPPSGPSWDLTILLTLVAVIVRASACAGFTLRGPPWQLEGRNAVALVWNDHLDTLPPDFPRLRVLPPPPQSARGPLSRRFRLHEDLVLTWDGCGASDHLSLLEAALRAL